MTILNYVGRLYSLDTLDTRFTKSAAKSPSLSSSNNARSNISAHDNAGGVNNTPSKPSLWRTPEFYLYYIIFIVAVPLMFKAAYDVSNRKVSSFVGSSSLYLPIRSDLG